MAESNTPPNRTVTVFRNVFFGLFLVATAIKVAFIFLRQDTDREAQQRMQENLRTVERISNFENEWPNRPGGIPTISNNERETMQAASGWLMTTADFLKQIRSGNLKAAYDSTSKSYKHKWSLEEFETMIRKYPEILDADQCHLKGKVYLNGKSSELGGSGSKDGNLKTLIRIDVRKEGTWVVDLFEVEPPIN